jgi:multisubunit Na+/H+ antiporter MnhG subunit
MREPVQGIHYLGMPATLGAVAVSIAVLLQTGPGSTFFKTLFLALLMVSINSVVGHATARAFRTRELGHWEPRAGDPMESVSEASGGEPKP